MVEETVTLEVAREQVRRVCVRLGLLHLAFAETIMEELGEEKGKKLILKAIKNYGSKCGEKVKKSVKSQGLDVVPDNYKEDLPEFGMHDRLETVEENGEKRIRAYGCVMAKVWKEYDKDNLGRFYCYVDPAKYMVFNPDYKLFHIKTIPDGDNYCELTIQRTSEKEKEDFASEDRDWSYIDR